MDQSSTPFFDQIKAFSDLERLSFHMPGNRGGKAFPEEFRGGFAALEATELNRTADLNDPTQVVLEAEALAAECFGAGKSFFLTSGSSMAIASVLSAVCSPGARIWVDPTSHRSLAHTAVLMDFELAFLPLSPSKGRSPLPKVDADAFYQQIQQKDFIPAEAIYICSPDYYGSITDLRVWRAIADELGVPLLVDEAHGASFVAAPEWMPPSSLHIGADLVVQSAHKTLPALAPSSLLHFSQNAMRKWPDLAKKILRTRPLFQTSSPSFPIAASLDWARSFLATRGHESIQSLLEKISEFKSKLPEDFKFLEASEGEDPTRMVIDFSESEWEAADLVIALEENGIDIEMTDLQRLVLIPALDQPREDFLELANVLQKLANSTAPHPMAKEEKSKRSAISKQLLTSLLRKREALRPRKSFFYAMHHNHGISIDEARKAISNGKEIVAGIPIHPYPPGIPLYYPGESLGEKDLDFLEQLLIAGLQLPSCSLDSFPFILH